jgi:hypothetical protein
VQILQKLPETLISSRTSSDRAKVRILLLSFVTAALAAAQSHPSWWTYASPDATALVGIQLENLHQSPFASTIEAQLSATGSLGFPNIDCLKQARQIILSAPATLAIEWGTFPAATLREQALRAGMGFVRYRTVAMWIPQNGSGMGVAQMTAQLVLVGARKTLEAAIDNSVAEKDRRYSPLLARAARFSRTADLWVVSTQLPDPLASLFVPLEAETQEFEGALSVQDGLHAEAWIDAESEQAAAGIAQRFKQEAPSFAPIARTVQVTAAANKVTLDLQLTSEQLASVNGATAPPVEAAVNVPVHPPAPAPAPAPKPMALSVAASVPPPGPVDSTPLFKVTVEKPAVPRVIVIQGLDDGPRVIPFPDPPAKF